MDQPKLIYDARTRKARLLLHDAGLHDLETGSKLFTIEGDWAYGVQTGAPTFWIDGKNLYLYQGGSKLALRPSLYLEEGGALRPARVVSADPRERVYLKKVNVGSRTTKGGFIHHMFDPVAQLGERAKARVEEIAAELGSLFETVRDAAMSMPITPTYLRTPPPRTGSKIIWNDDPVR